MWVLAGAGEYRGSVFVGALPPLHTPSGKVVGACVCGGWRGIRGLVFATHPFPPPLLLVACLSFPSPAVFFAFNMSTTPATYTMTWMDESKSLGGIWSLDWNAGS